VSFGDGHRYHIERIGTIRIKLTIEMVRELKNVRYISQLKKNLIVVRSLETKGLRETLGEGVLKMSNGSLIILKDIQRNNLYYLKSSVVTENLAASECLDGDYTRLWLMRLGYVGLDSLQALVK